MASLESARVSAAHDRALQRRLRKYEQLQHLGWAVVAIVCIATLTDDPRPGGHGKALGISIVLAVFLLSMMALMYSRQDAGRLQSVLVISVLGASGVVLAALQPDGAVELAPSVAVFVASVRLRPPLLGGAVGGSIAVALAIVAGITQSHAGQSVASALLLCVLLALMGYYMRRSGENEDRTELLLAQLQDAREVEAEAAAVAERGRIAGELHDVLAHSLSGLAIQIEGARMLADKEQASPRLRETIGRSAELVKEGLTEARQAVGALRGDTPPGVADLAEMVGQFGRDAGISTTFSVDGDGRPLPRDADTALYRGAQEALTNVARYAPGAHTTVALVYAVDEVTLNVVDRAAVGGNSPLAGMGAGFGLAAMSERVRRAGGTVQAGPTDDGWRVEIRVPR
jgi:signal transduction histidine kinase